MKNLPDSPGFLQNGIFTPNDSIWMDLGFPAMTGPDGRTFKPLFAPLIQDLDNRVNVNAHGFWFINQHNGAANPWNGTGNWCSNSYPSTNLIWGGQDIPPNVFTGNQGWGVWETRIDMVIAGTDSTQNPPTKEAAYLFGGLGLQGNNAVVPGRYDSTFWGSASFQLANGPAGHYYNVVDFDGPYQNPTYPNGTWDYFYFCNVGHFNGPDPSGSGHQATAGFFTSPLFGPQYHNGSCMSANSREELYSHPMLYNFFSPTQNCLSSAGQAQKDRRFAASHMEALLRYSDRGSPALTSDLFRLCPNSFSNPKTRRLVTTDSYDVVRPGLSPYIWDPTAAV